MRYSPRIVAISLDLYLKGISYRKISNHLKQFYDLTIAHTTICRWIKKYTARIGEYVLSLEPNFGNVWHSDEMKIKIKGEWRWLWNMMDKKTRFQLASEITVRREIADAQKAFQQAKKIGKKKPKLIITDGLQAYKRAFKIEFHDSKFSVRYVINSGFGLNGILERMQSGIREREKVLRGLKVDKTPIFKGWMIYYNFIRPHQALGGLTPADAAGIGVGGSWEELLRRSIKGTRGYVGIS
jgi:putative transposase